MAAFRNSAREFTRIAVPYFRSEDASAGRILLIAVIALQLFQVWLNVRFNAWYKTFYDALQNKDWDTFIWQLGIFSLLAWVMPFAAIVLGLGAIWWFIKRYAQKQAVAGAPEMDPEALKQYHERIEKDMAKFE